jgi:PH (Pleckstrin Homology) domain-containing protein
MTEHPERRYRFEVAPWPAALKVVSTIGVLLLGGVTVALVRAVPHGTRAPFAETFGSGLVFLPAVILGFAAIYVVRGYDLDASTLYVHRLLWTTRVPLEGLQHAWHDPAAMCRSMRLLGNGGLFSITGIYRNAALGRYRAFVTDPREAVVINIGRRVVVVSPAHPRAFLGQIASWFPAAVSPHAELH